MHDESTPLARAFAADVEKACAIGPIHRDEPSGRLVISGFAECLQVLNNDRTLTRADRFLPCTREFWGGGRMVLLSEGAEHRKLHALQMAFTGDEGAEFVDRAQIKHLAENLFEEFLSRHPCDLAKYADKLPPMVGCSNIGLDVTDVQLMERVNALRLVRDKWRHAIFAPGGCSPESEVAIEGAKAVEELCELFRPIVRARRERPEEDLVSRAWALGLATFPDWGERDMMGVCLLNFELGEISNFIRNALYLVLVDPELQESLRNGRYTVEGFIEEALRYFGPSWDAVKRAVTDTTVEGQPVRAGEDVQVIYAAANRDGRKYACPHSVDPVANEGMQHLAFGMGNRYCAGRGIARMVSRHAVAALLKYTEHASLDSSNAPASWHGDAMRTIRPLYCELRPTRRPVSPA